MITIAGSGLSGITSAWVGGGHDAGITNISDTLLNIAVPQDATSGQIALGNGTHWAFSGSGFTVAGAAAPSSGSSGDPPSNSIAPPGGSSSSSAYSGGSSSSKSASGSSSLVVRVSGDHLVDASGNNLQLRGVNASGLEFVAVQGWSPADPWGGQAPSWSAIKSWKANAVRIPLNEASWLGYTCADSSGATRNPDPGANYRSTVSKTVADATAAGLYVILDLHWTAPRTYCPLDQNPMADIDHSVAFWSSVASTYKGYSNVLLELFNEPFVGYGGPVSQADWSIIMQGGTQSYYITGGNPYQVNYTWQVAGMQQMLNAVRATGATNVVLIGTPSWAQDLSLWSANVPSDPLRQIAVVWHAYPNTNSPSETTPKLGTIAYTWAATILAAGYPIVISETGDHNSSGTVGAPYLAILLPWADAHDVSYLGWGWDVWQDSDNVLIKDSAGTPTDGYGVYFRQHLICRGGGAGSCP